MAKLDFEKLWIAVVDAVVQFPYFIAVISLHNFIIRNIIKQLVIQKCYS